MDTLFEAPCARAVHSPTRSQTNPSSHILVVDDDGDFRQLSAGALVSFGYRVDVAEDGEAAWKALHANSYDLLITDNKMPKISGVELVKKLRSAGMTLPVILMSGELPTEELNRSPWLQLAATLVKPFSRGQLLETVREVLLAADDASSRTAPFFPVPPGDCPKSLRRCNGLLTNSERKPRMKVGNLGEVLTFGGFKELTAANADMFRKEVHAAVNGHKVIEVDLSQTTFMDCGGLGALIALRNLARDRNSIVRLVNPTPPVHLLFEVMGVGNIFEIVDAKLKKHR